MNVPKYLTDNNIDQSMTAVNDQEFREIVTAAQINIAVEIGTYHGSSAAYLAEFANHVHTFDIRDRHNQKIWDDLGLSNKITFHKVKNKEAIDRILRDIEFDFAFIDDGHKFADCEADFNIVKRCGRVLFHDVNSPECPDVRKFVDTLSNIKIVGNNGYWEACL